MLAIIFAGIVGLLLIGIGGWLIYKGVWMEIKLERGEIRLEYGMISQGLGPQTVIFYGLFLFILGLLVLGGTIYYVCIGAMPF